MTMTMNNEIHGEDLRQMIESTGSPQGSRAFDELAIVFVVSPAGSVREQWSTPACGHAVEQDCPTCKTEQRHRERSRSRFQETLTKLKPLEGTPSCICDYPNRSAITFEQWEAVRSGHFNQAGGYRCPHHGNTCGHCHEYNS